MLSPPPDDVRLGRYGVAQELERDARVSHVDVGGRQADTTDERLVAAMLRALLDEPT